MLCLEWQRGWFSNVVAWWEYEMAIFCVKHHFIVHSLWWGQDMVNVWYWGERKIRKINFLYVWLIIAFEFRLNIFPRLDLSKRKKNLFFRDLISHMLDVYVKLRNSFSFITLSLFLLTKLNGTFRTNWAYWNFVPKIRMLQICCVMWGFF